jgi:hypothetical protein
MKDEHENAARGLRAGNPTVQRPQSTQRRLVQQQSALYVNDSESPFTAPPATASSKK